MMETAFQFASVHLALAKVCPEVGASAVQRVQLSGGITEDRDPAAKRIGR
jgi:hypothetical protein